MHNGVTESIALVIIGVFIAFILIANGKGKKDVKVIGDPPHAYVEYDGKAYLLTELKDTDNETPHR